MDIRAQLETAEFENACRRLAAGTKRALPAILDQAARLVVRDAIYFTPPFDNSSMEARATLGMRDQRMPLKEQRAIGEHAVTVQLRSLFMPLDAIRTFQDNAAGTKDHALSRAIGKAARAGNLALANQLLERGGWRERIIGGPTRALHNANRDKRGRINRTANVGDKRSGTRYFVQDAGALTAYIAGRVKKVLTGKAGWVKAGQALGLKLPAYFTKLGGSGVFSRSGTADKPAVVVGNAVPYIQAAGAELRVMTMATANVRRNFPTYIAHVLRGEARKARALK
jgi:hypothetical protein